MHGIIFAELKKFVEHRLGPDSWTTVVASAGIGTSTYMAVVDYPDDDAAALFAAIARQTGEPVDAVHQSYGTFIAPTLMDMYWALINPGWKTLDVLEHTEATIHRVVRAQIAGAQPPVLACQRISQRELIMTYTSQRKMCGMAKGTAIGVSMRYGERLTIEESSCMRHGADRCMIAFAVEAD